MNELGLSNGFASEDLIACNRIFHLSDRVWDLLLGDVFGPHRAIRPVLPLEILVGEPFTQTDIFGGNQHLAVGVSDDLHLRRRLRFTARPERQPRCETTGHEGNQHQ